MLYGTDTIQTYPAADNAGRRRYGWFQRYSILDDFPAIYNAWCARKTEKKSFIRKMVDKLRQSPLLLRLVEILCAAKVQRGQAGETVLEGTEVQILADVVAQRYACLTECRFGGPLGLAAYAELSSMAASLMLGEWFD